MDLRINKDTIVQGLIVWNKLYVVLNIDFLKKLFGQLPPRLYNVTKLVTNLWLKARRSGYVPSIVVM